MVAGGALAKLITPVPNIRVDKAIAIPRIVSLSARANTVATRHVGGVSGRSLHHPAAFVMPLTGNPPITPDLGCDGCARPNSLSVRESAAPHSGSRPCGNRRSQLACGGRA